MITKRTHAWSAALIVAVFTTAPAEGQTQGWTASVGAGPSFPVSGLSAEAKTGYHVQGSVGHELPSLPFGLRFDLFYQLFRNVEREPSLHTSIGGEWFRQANGFVSATYALPVGGSIEPYALVGGGWGQEWHGDKSHYGTRQGNVSLNLGGGVNFPVFGASGFVEARFVGLLGGDPLPLRPPAVQQEVRFQSIPITFGFRF